MYLRDGRAPIPEKEATSRIMSAIKHKNTKPELLLRKMLWNNGMKGYRIHWSKLPGKPDIAFPRKKLAIFVNGCFWHRCPYCKPALPKSHSTFWKIKFEKNVERDKKKSVQLRTIGWKSITIWECQINLNTNDILNKIKTKLH